MAACHVTASSVVLGTLTNQTWQIVRTVRNGPTAPAARSARPTTAWCFALSPVTIHFSLHFWRARAGLQAVRPRVLGGAETVADRNPQVGFNAAACPAQKSFLRTASGADKLLVVPYCRL